LGWQRVLHGKWRMAVGWALAVSPRLSLGHCVLGQYKTPGSKKLQGSKNKENSSFIQTLTVGSRIQLDQPFGSRAIPPVGTCTLP